MLKRWWIYFKEMFPLPFHLLLGFIVFFEIYFVLLLNYDVTEFNIGFQEIICAFSLFVFLLLLRIADDFKDYKTDLKDHPERPLPSGRVSKKDLVILLTVVLLITMLLNFVYMNNFVFLLLVFIYGLFMSLWYNYSKILKNNFVFMMFTHTPFLFLMNLYVISFACIKYGLEPVTYITVLLSFTVYCIGFIRGLAREIKVLEGSSKEENGGIISKVGKYKREALLVAVLAVFNTAIDIVLLWNLSFISILFLSINLIWLLFKITRFIKESKGINILNKSLIYITIQECIVILTVVSCFFIS